jgi:hypothetical protein
MTKLLNGSALNLKVSIPKNGSISMLMERCSSKLTTQCSWTNLESHHRCTERPSSSKLIDFSIHQKIGRWFCPSKISQSRRQMLMLFPVFKKNCHLNKFFPRQRNRMKNQRKKYFWTAKNLRRRNLTLLTRWKKSILITTKFLQNPTKSRKVLKKTKVHKRMSKWLHRLIHRDI